MSKRSSQLNSEIETALSRTFRTRIQARATDDTGTVNYTLTDRITPRNGGIEVTTHASGMAEGERVDQKSVQFYAGKSLDAAASYRLRNGWTEIK